VAISAIVVALFLPATAWAHSRAPTVAIDYRFHLDASPPGVQVSILDGDRALRVTVASGTTLLVRGYLHEPELRIGPAGVWVNASSPTATADRLVAAGRHGWVQRSTGHTSAWHEHRLAPAGPGGRFRIPIVVDGHPAAIAGTFIRVPRPASWPWIAIAIAFLAAVTAAARHGRSRVLLTLGLGVLSGVAALPAIVGFALRDQTKGGTDWLTITIAGVIALALTALVIRASAHRRPQVAGVAGVIAAAAMITALPIFWHGVVISALPATAARLASALAFFAGTSAAVVGLLLETGDGQANPGEMPRPYPSRTPPQ
jgi:hypothetical protein